MSKIEWTEATWNPVVGCSLASPGCTNCYAMKMAGRIEATGHPSYQGLTQRTKAGFAWTGELALNEKALLEPLRRRMPTVYFVNSMGDLFHEDCPDDWIDRVFAVMALAPQHTFQVLTKRSARMREYCKRHGPLGPVPHAIINFFVEGMSPTGARSKWGKQFPAHVADIDVPKTSWPLPHVWLGVSVEDQARADERVPDLLATPAAVRWLSCEPLLGPVDLRRVDEQPTSLYLDALTGMIYDELGERSAHLPRGLDWIVAGGESGPGARPMHPELARSLRDQCAAAGVPFFFKQWGEFAPGEIAGDYLNPERRAKGMSYFDGRWDEAWSEVEGHCDDEPDVYRVGKKRAGRLLDGVLHDAMPEQAT